MPTAVAVCSEIDDLSSINFGNDTRASQGGEQLCSLRNSTALSLTRLARKAEVLELPRGALQLRFHRDPVAQRTRVPTEG